MGGVERRCAILGILFNPCFYVGCVCRGVNSKNTANLTIFTLALFVFQGFLIWL